MRGQQGIVLVLLVGWVVSGYSIESYSEVYSCGLSLHNQVAVHMPPHFNFSKSCEQGWTKLPENISIASVTPHSKPQCATPCVQVSHRKLILSECSEVKVIITCDDGIKILEKRIDFHGKLASHNSYHHVDSVAIPSAKPATAQPFEEHGITDCKSWIPMFNCACADSRSCCLYYSLLIVPTVIIFRYIIWSH